MSSLFTEPDFKAYVKREGFRTREEALNFIYKDVYILPDPDKHHVLLVKRSKKEKNDRNNNRAKKH